MKVFSTLLLTAFCVGAVFSSALPEENAAPTETATAVPAVTPADATEVASTDSTTVPPTDAPAVTPTDAPAVAPTTVPAKPKPSRGPRPTKGPGPTKVPRPPKDATIAEAKKLEIKLEKALKESRGKLEKLEKALGETKEVTLAKLVKIKDELLAKAKVARKEGNKGLRKALIRNVIILDQLKLRISKLK